MKKSVTKVIAGGLSLVAFGSMVACTPDGNETITDTQSTTSSVDGSTNATTGNNTELTTGISTEATTKNNTVPTTEKNTNSTTQRVTIPTTRPETTTKPESSGIQQELKSAPSLEGATKVIKERNGYERVIYEAKAGNPYGVEAGTYIGEFKDDVKLDGKKVGGDVLIPTVAKYLLKEKLNSGKSWLVFVPADISELKNKNTEVKLTIMNGPSGMKDMLLKVDCNGETISVSTPVVSPNKKTWFIESSIPGGPFAMATMGLYSGVLTQDSMKVAGQFKFTDTTSRIVPFGKEVTNTNKPVLISVGNMDTTGVISESRILENNGCPVFVIDK